MRAVNLIPADEQLRSGPQPTKSAGAVYVLLAALAVVLVLAGSWTLLSRSVADRRDEVARTRVDLAAAQGTAAALAPEVAFAGQRVQRTETVRALSDARFDWSGTLAELARVLPRDVWLTALQGTRSPDAALSTAAVSGTQSLRSALPVPAIELTGCTVSQDRVAGVLRALRLMRGATRVSLQSSERNQEAAKGAATGASATTSTGGRLPAGLHALPQFSVVVFFDPAAGTLGAADAATRTIGLAAP